MELLWQPAEHGPFRNTAPELLEVVGTPRVDAYVVAEPTSRQIGVGLGGDLLSARGNYGSHPEVGYPVLASLSAVYPERLGSLSFLETHGVRFPYVAGAMANGIATSALVIAMAKAKMLGFFGAAGLDVVRIEAAIDEIRAALPEGAENWGANLIHSPLQPEMEEQTVDLYLKKQVRRVSASAYLQLTPSIVRFACSGLKTDPNGQIQRVNHVFAKISQPSVARQFMSPPPPAILDKLVADGRITAAEAQLAQHVPIAEDVTVESDSGGHTDNRPLFALLPGMLALRDELTARFGYTRPIRVGAAGGLGTPSGVAGAFAAGADYVLTGSVNQAAIEAGISPEAREMLARAEVTDVTMAPAPDMFEAGIKVQVLKRGTLYAARAAKLYELYRTHDGLADIPAEVVQQLEREIFQLRLDEVWDQATVFFQQHAPSEIERAQRDPKHKMALVFRWYLGLSSKWAIAGDPDRRLDYQIWCGPAMGAFNAWTVDSPLANPEKRGVVQIARNLLEGAAHITRAQQLRCSGVPVPPAAFCFRPRLLA